MAFTYVTITRDYDTADGLDPVGYVYFTPCVPMINGSVTVVASPIKVLLNIDGQVSISLAANTDPSTTPTGTYYNVLEDIQGQPRRTYSVIIPHNVGGTIDLGSLAQLDTPPAVSAYLTQTLADARYALIGQGGGISSLPTTVLYRLPQTSSGYPARPATGYVDWLGSSDPGALLVWGDTWTQIPTSAPNAPTIGTVTAGNAQASVAFAAPSWNGGSAITSFTATSTPGSFTASGASSPLVVTGLSNGTSYTFKVKATNGLGVSPDSAASNNVIPTVGGGATLAGAPTIGTASSGDGEATVTFTPPGSNGGSSITSYLVTSSPGSVTGSGSSSPVTVTGLTNGTAYTFTVKAINGVGTGPASAASNSVTPAGSGSSLTDAFTGSDGDPWSSTVWKTQPGSPNLFATGWTIVSNHGRISGTSAGSFESTGRKFNMTNAENWRVRAHIVTPPVVSGWEFQIVLQATTWSFAGALPETAYVAYGNASSLYIIKRVSNSASTLVGPISLAATDRWVDIKVISGVMSYKAWTGTISDAPGSYTGVINGSPLSGTGEAGIYFAAAGGVAGLTQIDIDDVLVDNNPS